jgi:hypothetical protein
MKTKPAKSSKSSQPDRPQYAWIFYAGFNVVSGNWQQSWDREFEEAHLDWRKLATAIRLPKIDVQLSMANKKARSFPHVFVLYDRYYVSQEFKDCVESLDGAIHNFIPLTLSSKTETFSYYILNCTQRIYMERFDLSNVSYSMNSMGIEHPNEPFKDNMLAIDGNKISRIHLWQGFYIGRYYMSDQLYKKLKSLKRLNIRFDRVKVVY